MHEVKWYGLKIKRTMNNSSLGRRLDMIHISSSRRLTDSAADGDEQLPDRLRVVHHDGFDCAVQHFDLLRPLFLLVLQNILKKKTPKKQKTKTQERKQSDTIKLILLDI